MFSNIDWGDGDAWYSSSVPTTFGRDCRLSSTLEITPKLCFSTKSNDVVQFLKPQFVGRTKHTEYPNLPMVVLWQLAFSGRRDGGFRTQKIIFQTTQNQRNFTLMEKLENRKLKDRSALRHLRLTMIIDSTGHLVSIDKVQGSFISHYLHKINIERKV